MIGEQVGNYLVENLLGEGGMGAVYRAHHVMLKRPAAIKVLLPQYSVNPEVVQRFFNEAKAATSIRHLGIVEIYDFGMLPNGTAYIAMELLQGESLALRMQLSRVSLATSLGIIRQMCGALGAAHALGIVHRDLKPDNVFIVPDPEVPGGERIKLLDFGIAKLTQEPEGMSHKTRTGALMGTPVYMSPEQCRGVAVDRRADIYALGCILYELITGRPPFVGEGVGDILGAHMYKAPEPLDALAPGTPPGVVGLVDRMLAKDPTRRFQTTAEVIEAIDAIDMRAGPIAARHVARTALAETLPGSDSAGRETAPSTTLSGSAIGMSSPPPRTGRRHIMVGGVVVATAASVTGLVLWWQRPHSGAVPTIDAQVTRVATPAPVDAPADVMPAPITVTLDSIPSGARVLLDGNEVGVTPFRATYPRHDGRLAFTLARKGFQDDRVEVAADQDTMRTEKLVPVPARHGPAVHHDTSPPRPETPSGSGSASEDDDAVNPLRGKLKH